MLGAVAGAVAGAVFVLAGIVFLLTESGPIGLASLVVGAAFAIGTFTSLVMHRRAGGQSGFSDLESDDTLPELETEIERTQEARDTTLRRESLRDRYGDAQSVEIEGPKRQPNSQIGRDGGRCTVHGVASGLASSTCVSREARPRP